MLPILFLLLLFNIGCFSSSSSSSHHHHHRRRRKPSTAVLNYLKRLFSGAGGGIPPPPPPSIPSPSSSTRSLRLNPPRLAQLDTSVTNTNTTRTRHQAAALVAPADIHPCTVCGEILQSPTALHHHQSTKHGVSDLADGENVVRLIFLAGWPAKPAGGGAADIGRVLKIHNTPRALARFEDHRRLVAAGAGAGGRCAADGNELLRFHCTTFLCGLDGGVCGHQFCGACGIIRCGFSGKLDGIATMPTGWKAHAALPADVEEEFGFLCVRRAVLVCRVIAGRVGTLSDAGGPDPGPEFDSLVGPGGDELFVFSPRAILPCFVIVYTV